MPEVRSTGRGAVMLPSRASRGESQTLGSWPQSAREVSRGGSQGQAALAGQGQGDWKMEKKRSGRAAMANRGINGERKATDYAVLVVVQVIDPTAHNSLSLRRNRF